MPNIERGKMKHIADVSIGQVVVTKEKIVLRCLALGSCIGIAAYDAKEKTGGMAHIMLPDRAPAKAVEKTRYAANAIDDMIGQMAKMGSRPSGIDVCLVGGGNVLGRADDTICQSNIESAKRILESKGIVIQASSLGGTKRKSVLLDIDNGRISYTEGDEKQKVLWQAHDGQPG